MTAQSDVHPVPASSIGTWDHEPDVVIAGYGVTALNIWRNVEDGPRRVTPTLQPLRPLRGGLAPRPARESAALQYA